jgi:hypothetical protein
MTTYKLGKVAIENKSSDIPQRQAAIVAGLGLLPLGGTRCFPIRFQPRR